MNLNSIISNYPLLSAEDEQKYISGYIETKNKVYLDKLVLHNLRLVCSIINKYRFPEKDREDLFQEGVIGLIKAVEKFDPTRGVPFVNYASLWVTAYVMRYLMDKITMVKTCTTQNKRKLFFSLAKERAKLANSNIVLSDKELAEKLNVSESDILEVTMLGTQYKSIDEFNKTTKERGESLSVAQVDTFIKINEKLSTSIEKELTILSCKNKFQELCSEFKSNLNSKYSEVFSRRIENPMSDTFEEIGKDLHVTRQRAQQMEEILLNNFKKTLLSNNFKQRELELALSIS